MDRVIVFRNACTGGLRGVLRALAGGLDDLICSGWSAAILTLAAITCGAIASIYSATLQEDVPKLLTFDFVTLSPEVIYFGKALLVFTILYGLREIRLGGRLKRDQRKLIETINTMPPKALISASASMFRQLLDTIHREVDSKRGEEKVAASKETLRIALDYLGSLVAKFERSPLNTVYSVNIMRYVPIVELDGKAAVKSLLHEQLRFIQPKSLDSLEGVLWLCTELSSTSAVDDSSAIDTSLKPLALPIPRSGLQLTDKSNFIPGAPEAFDQGVSLVADTSKMADIAEEYCNLRAEEVAEIKTYFLQDSSKRIGSILCIRLPGDTHPGVINIHCSKSDILSGDDQLYNYIHLVTPFVETIYRLMANLPSAVNTLQECVEKEDQHAGKSCEPIETSHREALEET